MGCRMGRGIYWVCWGVRVSWLFCDRASYPYFLVIGIELEIRDIGCKPDPHAEIVRLEEVGVGPRRRRSQICWMSDQAPV